MTRYLERCFTCSRTNRYDTLLSLSLSQYVTFVSHFWLAGILILQVRVAILGSRELSLRFSRNNWIHCAQVVWKFIERSIYFYQGKILNEVAAIDFTGTIQVEMRAEEEIESLCMQEEKRLILKLKTLNWLKPGIDSEPLLMAARQKTIIEAHYIYPEAIWPGWRLGKLNANESAYFQVSPIVAIKFKDRLSKLFGLHVLPNIPSRKFACTACLLGLIEVTRLQWGLIEISTETSYALDSLRKGAYKKAHSQQGKVKPRQYPRTHFAS